MMTVAAVRLAHAIASPTPITDEPTYNGWATNLYGPDEVTSRPFFKWPAAQKRMASPAAATLRPMPSDRGVGWASASTIAPNTNPSVTRRRASARMTMCRGPSFCNRVCCTSDTTRLQRQPTVDRRDDFFHRHIEQTHARLPAPPQVMTAA